MILLVDNYDSFTYNLAHLFGELGADVVVRRNDEIDEEEAASTLDFIKQLGSVYDDEIRDFSTEAPL